MQNIDGQMGALESSGLSNVNNAENEDFWKLCCKILPWVLISRVTEK